MILKENEILLDWLSSDLLLFVPVSCPGCGNYCFDGLATASSQGDFVDIRKVEDYNAGHIPGSHQRLLRGVGHSESGASQRTARR